MPRRSNAVVALCRSLFKTLNIFFISRNARIDNDWLVPEIQLKIQLVTVGMGWLKGWGNCADVGKSLEVPMLKPRLFSAQLEGYTSEDSSSRPLAPQVYGKTR